MRMETKKGTAHFLANYGLETVTVESVFRLILTETVLYHSSKNVLLRRSRCLPHFNSKSQKGNRKVII